MEDGKISYVAELDDKGFAEGARSIQRQVRDVTSRIEKDGSRIDEVFDKIGSRMKQAFAISSIVAFEKKIIDVRSEMESLQKSFESLAGEHIGRKLYEDIKQFATTTPMMAKDLAKGAQTLLGFNIEAEKVMPILRQIGDISMGDAQKFNSLTLAFAQMSSTGKLMGQDLLQMVNAGFNPLVVISEKTGKSIAKLKDEMSEGKITVEMVEEAFRSATAEGGKFHNMLEDQSKTMKGALSNLQGAYEEMLNEIGEKQQGVMLKGVELAQTIVQNYEKVGQVLLGLIATYGTYRTAVMAVSVAEGIANGQIVLKIRALRACAAAQALLNKTMLANPYVLAATALGVLVGAIIATRDGLTDAERAQRDYNATLEEAKRQQEEYNSETEKAIGLAQDESAATEDREGAMQTLINRYPEIIKKYIDEKGHLTDILNLKREIAAYDGKLANLDNKTRAEMYTRYIQVLQKAKRGEQLDETETILYQGAQKKYEDATSSFNRYFGDYTDSAVDYFRNLAKEANRAYGRGNTVEKVTKFMETLGDMKTKELEALTKSLRNSESKLGNKLAIKVKELNDFLERSDLDAIITKAEGIIEARKGKKKELTDKEKAAAANAAEKAEKERAEAADKQFQINMKREEAQIEQERRVRAASEAERIANIQDAGKREVAAEEEAHRLRLEAIDKLSEEYQRKRYELNRQEYESQNKGEYYSATEEGSSGWQGVALTDDELREIEAKRSEELAKHRVWLDEHRKQEKRSMYEYLREYGNYEEKRKAITDEYNAKIEEASNEWERKMLTRQRDELLGTLRITEQEKSEEYLKFFSSIYSMTADEAENIGEKIRKNLDEALQAGTISAQQYYETVEKIDDQLAKIQNDRGPVMAFLEGGLTGLSTYYTQKGRDTRRAGSITVEQSSKSLKQQVSDAINGGEIDFNKWMNSAMAKKSGENMMQAGEAMQEAGEGMGNTIMIIDKIINGIDAIVQGFKAVNDEIKEIYGNDYGFNQSGTNFLNAFSNASGAAASGWNSLKNGDIQGAVNGTIGSWTEWLKKETSETSYWKSLEDRLERMQGALNSIDNHLVKRLDMAYGSESQTAADKLIADYRTLLAQTRENANAWLDSSTLHHNHRNWYYLWKGDDDYGYNDPSRGNISWEREMGNIYKGLGISNGDGIWGLAEMSKEQLEWVQDNFRDLWMKLPEEYRKYLEAIIDYEDKIKETAEGKVKALVGLDLETLKSDYVDFLSDVDAENEETAEKFEGYLRKALMSNLVADNYTERIQSLIDAANSIANKAKEEGRDFTEDEIEYIRGIEAGISSDMAKDKERLSNLFNWDGVDEEAKKNFESIREAWVSTVMEMKGDTESLGKEIARIMFESIVNEKVFDKEFDTWLEGWTSRLEEAMNVQAPSERESRLNQLAQERADKIEELTSKTKEYAEATGYSAEATEEFSNSLDNLGDTLIDALLDTEKDAAQVGKEIGQTLAKEMLAEMLSTEKYANWKEDIRKMWQAILKGEDTEHTIDDVLGEITKLNEAIANDEDIDKMVKKYQEWGKTLEDISTSFGDLHDSIMNSILDMENGIEDFANDMNQKLVKDLIEKQVFGKPIDITWQNEAYHLDNYEKYQENWTQRYYDIYNDVTLSEEEREKLLQALVDEMIAQEQILNGAAQDLAKRYQKKKVDTTFTDMTDSFVSALMDMDGSIEDFAKNMKETIIRHLIEGFMVSDKIKPMFDDLQKTFDYMMSQKGWTDQQRLDFMTKGGQDNEGKAYRGIDNYTKEWKAWESTVDGMLSYYGLVKKETDELLSSITSNLNSMLTDSEKTGKDFASSLKESVINSLIDAYTTTEKFQDKLAEVKKQMKEAIESGNPAKIEAAERAAENFYKTAAAGVKTYTDALDQAEQEQETIFDNMRDSFRNSIMDMTKTGKDFAKDLSKTFTEEFVDKFVMGEAFDKVMQDFEDDYLKIMGNKSLSKEERAEQGKQIIAAAQKYYEAQKAEAKTWGDLMGINSKEDQSAYMNTAQSFNYDQADLIGGMVTSILMGQTEGNKVRQEILATLRAMDGITNPNSEVFAEMSDNISRSANYLSHIEQAVSRIDTAVASNAAAVTGILSKLS